MRERDQAVAGSWRIEDREKLLRRVAAVAQRQAVRLDDVRPRVLVVAGGHVRVRLPVALRQRAALRMPAIECGAGQHCRIVASAPRAVAVAESAEDVARAAFETERTIGGRTVVEQKI